MTNLQETLTWRGHEIADRDGDKIGTIEEIYMDAQTEQPDWALVHTGMFGTKRSFVPLREATHEGDTVRVPYEKQQVKDAPSIDPDGELSQTEDDELYRHYGLDHGGAAVGRDVSGPTTHDAMTRSEEEPRVGTAEREAGRAHLRKYVVEKEVTQTVPVRREEVRVEREPITEGNADAALAGPEISEEEHEVVLHEEEPVVETRAVPKERVRLDKDTTVEEEQVSGTVRKEQVDVEGATERR